MGRRRRGCGRGSCCRGRGRSRRRRGRGAQRGVDGRLGGRRLGAAGRELRLLVAHVAGARTHALAVGGHHVLLVVVHLWQRRRAGRALRRRRVGARCARAAVAAAALRGLPHAALQVERVLVEVVVGDAVAVRLEVEEGGHLAEVLGVLHVLLREGLSLGGRPHARLEPLALLGLDVVDLERRLEEARRLGEVRLEHHGRGLDACLGDPLGRLLALLRRRQLREHRIHLLLRAHHVEGAKRGAAPTRAAAAPAAAAAGLLLGRLLLGRLLLALQARVALVLALHQRAVPLLGELLVALDQACVGLLHRPHPLGHQRLQQVGQPGLGRHVAPVHGLVGRPHGRRAVVLQLRGQPTHGEQGVPCLLRLCVVLRIEVGAQLALAHPRLDAAALVALRHPLGEGPPRQPRQPRLLRLGLAARLLPL